MNKVLKFIIVVCYYSLIPICCKKSSSYFAEIGAFLNSQSETVKLLCVVPGIAAVIFSVIFGVILLTWPITWLASPLDTYPDDREPEFCNNIPQANLNHLNIDAIPRDYHRNKVCGYCGLEYKLFDVTCKGCGSFINKSNGVVIK
jgi:hypothetical protein